MEASIFSSHLGHGNQIKAAGIEVVLHSQTATSPPFLYADVWSTASTVFVLRAMQPEVVNDDKHSHNTYAQRHAKAAIHDVTARGRHDHLLSMSNKTEER